MELSLEQLTSFQSLYRNHFGIDLTVQEAQEKALALLVMVKATYRPITKEDEESTKQRKIKMNIYGGTPNGA